MRLVKARCAIPPKQLAAARPGPPKWNTVCNAIGQHIVEGRLRSGELLPIEADLAREFGISRPSLREGLRALAAKRLVETRKPKCPGAAFALAMWR